MSMRAVVHERYGAPEEVLKGRRIDKPQIDRDEVLVRVHAAVTAVPACTSTSKIGRRSRA
jgi:hypothetical protein